MLHENLGCRRRGAWVALLGLTLTAAGWTQGTLACGLSGDGSAGTPWQVASAADLAQVGVTCPLAGYYSQTTNIDLGAYSAGSGWNPIGSTRSSAFSGTYDGGGHAITGLVITRDITQDYDGVGLFGHNSGTINNLQVSGTVTAIGGCVGGLVGYNYGHITQASAAVTVEVIGGGLVGGLVGDNWGYLTKTSASGAVTVTGGGSVGGLAGYNYGGLIARASASGAVTVTGSYSGVGGLVGRGGRDSDIYHSSASGAVTVTGDHNVVGGLVGNNWGYLTRTIASGAVTVTGEDSWVGGLTGSDYLRDVRPDGGIVASFWDIETTGQPNGAGIAMGPGAGLFGKSTADLQTLATFTADSVKWPIVPGWLPPASAGDNVWGICQAANNGYPFLLWTYSTDPCTIAFGAFAVNQLVIYQRLKSLLLVSNFTLGTDSNGVNPTSDGVTFEIASFRTTIPAGAFRELRGGVYVFAGKVDNVAIEATIAPLGGKRFAFQVAAYGASLNGTVNPVTVKLGIGDDNGTTTIKAVIK